MNLTLIACMGVLAWSFVNVALARDLMHRTEETRQETEDLLNYIQHLQGYAHEDDN